MLSIVVLVAVCVLSSPVSALLGGGNSDPVFKFGKPSLHGSGCPDGSVDLVESTDGSAISLLFSKYQAATLGDVTRQRVDCKLGVPVTMKPGISIGVFKVDYRGNAYVPNKAGARADFSAEYFFAGSRGPITKKRYNPGFDDDIFITHKVAAAAIVWSPCGASTNFRINTAISVKKGKRSDEDAQIAIDSVDATTEKPQYLKYAFFTKRC